MAAPGIKPPEDCRWDLGLRPGAMLRLNPGAIRITTTRSSQAALDKATRRGAARAYGAAHERCK